LGASLRWHLNKAGVEMENRMFLLDHADVVLLDLMKIRRFYPVTPNHQYRDYARNFAGLCQ
jgi:hypothetical protein